MTAMSKERSTMKLRNSYWLVRIIFLRLFGLIFMVAFLIAWKQNDGLLGDNGLTPMSITFDNIRNKFGDVSNSSGISVLQFAKIFWNRFSNVPSLFWILPATITNLQIICACGFFSASIPFIFGASNMLLMIVIWICYSTIVNVGNLWYSFGWESQLLETCFLSLFLVPMLSIRKFPKNDPPSFTSILGLRWLVFRIMLGAGLIKLRGDPCWLNFTCMHYFYQTEPIPNPLTPLFHQQSDMFHRLEVLVNHIVELPLPFFMFFPRTLRLFGTYCQILFQILIILSGNLSLLNWLTILPAIMGLDDACVTSFFPEHALNRAMYLHSRQKKHAQNLFRHPLMRWRFVIDVMGLCIIIVFSIPCVVNLFSPNQIMNTSFNNLRLINTYGAFGAVSKIRHEVIIQVTNDTTLSSSSQWIDIEFPCKPGNIDRTPCWIAPYHYRLDWLMWFASQQRYEDHPWIVHLGMKILMEEPSVVSLLAPPGSVSSSQSPCTELMGDNFHPKYLRMELYEYQYMPFWSKSAKPMLDNCASEELSTTCSLSACLSKSSESMLKPSSLNGLNGWEEGRWWRRKFIRPYFPAILTTYKTTEIPPPEKTKDSFSILSVYDVQLDNYLRYHSMKR